MKDTLKRIAWLGTKWDIMSIEKYQLFPHNLNTYANVWLFFTKKKIMLMRHDNMISMDKAMLLYCIMEEIPVNGRDNMRAHPRLGQTSTWHKTLSISKSSCA